MMMKISNFKKSLVYKNLSALVISELIIRASKFVVIALAARALGVVDFGKFNYLLSLAALVAVVGDLGVGKIITRDIASDKTLAENYISTVAIQGIALLTYASIGLGLFKLTSNDQLAWAFSLLALFTSINLLSDYLWSFLRGYEKMRPEAIGKALQAIVILIGGVIVLWRDPSLIALSVVYVVGACLTLVIAIISVRKFLPLQPVINLNQWLRLLKQSWPVALVAVSAFVFNQIDSVMLGWQGLFDQVGLYNASYKIISVALIPMMLLNQVLYPRFSMNTQSVAFKIVKNNMLVNFVSYTLLLGVIMIFGSQILNFIFSSAYIVADTSLVILATSTIFTALIYPISNFLIARDYLFINLWLSIFAAIINIALNLMLIPVLGYNGAAIATFITYGLLLTGYMVSTRRIISDPDQSPL